MPNGFIGNAPAAYLGGVHKAYTQAIEANIQISADTPSSTTATGNVRRLPFEPDDARVGQFVTGKGDSSNIVVDSSDYTELTQRISHADDKMGECLYRIALEIEEMCRTIYILPETLPRCMNVSSAVKTSLSEFRSLTEEAVSVACSFARDIANIGR